MTSHIPEGYDPMFMLFWGKDTITFKGETKDDKDTEPTVKGDNND